MASYIRQKFSVVAKIAYLCFSLSLLLASSGWAQESIDAKIASYIEKLKDPEASVRQAAAYALRVIKPEAEAAIPALIEALKDPDDDVRENAAYTLGAIGLEAEVVIPALIEAALKDPDDDVRESATSALEIIGPEAEAVVPALIEALKDPHDVVRGSAASALEAIGPEAKAAVPALIEALKDPHDVVRENAAHALASIGPEAEAVVPTFIEAALKDPDDDVRHAAAVALGFIGPEAKAAVPALIEALKDPHDFVARGSAAHALEIIGPEAKAAVPALIEALKDPDDFVVRGSAASALEAIGSEAKAAVPALIEALKDPHDFVRGKAASALGTLGPEAKAAVPALIEALKDKDRNFFFRETAASALGRIAESLQDAGHTDSIHNLEEALKVLREGTFEKKVIKPVERALQALKDRRRAFLFDRVFDWIVQSKWVSVIAVYVVFLLSLCFSLLWLRPLWLLKINQALKPYTDQKLPDWLGGMKIPARYVLLLGFFHYHSRVLDAWIIKHIGSARDEFLKKDKVKDRKVHVPVPVVCDGETVPDLTGKHLQPTFAGKRGCLLIWGEGGSGKTSLACQVAKWAMSDDKAERLCDHLMVPILIESELNFKVEEGKRPFMEAIRGQLQALVEADPIPEELFEHLLRQRRLLIVVDGFSEISEATRMEIRPGHPNFPVNALIVTSRLEEKLDDVPKTVVKPLRIKGNRLSSFMEAYLTQRSKRDLFDDPEFFDACRGLSKMVGDRDITVLLAELYAEQMISSKESTVESNLPNNIPDLMLNYLNELNHSAVGNKPSDRTVHRIAKTLAWECLKRTYRPMPAKLDDVLAALSKEDDPEACIKYLEGRLRLIQTIVPGQDQIRFTLDPLAEYLAGLYLVDYYGEKEGPWREFFIQADNMPGAPWTIKGFLLAVRDCCLVARRRETRVPDFVPAKLAKRAGLDPESVNVVQLRSTPKVLSESDIVQMIQEKGFNHPRDLSHIGLSGSITGSFQRRYKKMKVAGDWAVIDQATGLMWQQSGSFMPMPWEVAKDFIAQLNIEGHGEFLGWRLPTVEELASLLEATKKNEDLYIDSVFDTREYECWSIDENRASRAVWVVNFRDGAVRGNGLDSVSYVRAVRSSQ